MSMNNTIRIPLDPQPPKGVTVEMIGSLVSPVNGERSYYHAMTIAHGDDTIFYHCPLGMSGDELILSRLFHGPSMYFRTTDLNVDCVDGVWCWVVDCDFLYYEADVKEQVKP